jgi:hypothetical protein
VELVLPRLSKRQDFLTEWRRHRAVMRADQLALLSFSRNEHRINAIGTGALT